MALKTKVDSSFWSDDDVGKLSPDQKLAILWVLTNKDMNNIGFLKVSRRQFEFDTSLPIKVLEGAMKGLPRSFIFEDRGVGLEVLAINYVQYQFGDRSLHGKNHIVKHLCALWRDLNEVMREAILERYEDLAKVLSSPLSPLQGPSSPLQGAYKPPEQSRAEQSRESVQEGMQGEDSPGSLQLRFDLATECVDFLNSRAGTKFPATHALLHQVALRLQEAGGDVSAVKRMIDRQVQLWKNDPKMKSFLRPATLFEAEKFHNYFGQRELPAMPTRPDERRKELERLIERSPANRETVYHNPNATAADREQLAEYRRELRGLTKNFAPAETAAP